MTSNTLDRTNKEYVQILDEAKQKITSARIFLTRVATQQQFNLYWWLGQKIAEAQEKYGALFFTPST